MDAGQFVRVGHRVKINDFNRARFLATNITATDGSVCPFYIENDSNEQRSPEEYLRMGTTDKVC